MPAYFEKGVFTDAQPAWHGQGVVRPEEFLTLAQIGETVPELVSPIVRCPVFAAFADPAKEDGDDDRYAAINTPDWWMNVRAYDRKCVGVTSDRYQLIQPEVMYDLGEAIVDQGGRWKTSGTMKDGRIAWGLLELPGELEIAGEIHKRFLMVTNSYDGSTPLSAYLCDTRVVCWNTWNVAIGESPRSWAIRHSASAEGRIQEARLALGLAWKMDEALKELGDRLVAQKHAPREVSAFVRKLIVDAPKPRGYDSPATKTEELAKAKWEVEHEKVEARRFDLGKVIGESPNLENIRGTRWGTLQGTIEWTQRYMAPGRSPESTLRRTVIHPPTVNARAVELLSA